ncbi:sugar phosphate isomerase/epimerase family protein [Actinomadura madurae]|uniref:sugar phosphate isomerase/epimerase family protein n=1 Tax=Actinomadura madurae TaxID=1993 RepID=UPI002026EDD2|nr:sugar phosphate isomerase/epimerase family protein [Actinomadura madurae]MCP9948163.1 sugar phosphate isomerase/epimerase [Actinomadura madurae]MCP9964934.1 sugar phosphate isomerase/epimerase [Actinomadura madurae]MCP9977422.1 sugar phosphate isomerase/epimerase [Actinomadura madurae]MCQ0011073.1 sugar phosphate isomerase/epimerase [Actinomadura madurae]MCQ0013605.1 sugar phosphate isomerase/epimerase [Actinomadura madurae]
MQSAVKAPRFAVNSYSTPHNTIYQDVEQVAAIGGAAVGLWEGKFADGDDERIARSMKEHGLEAAFCVPRMHSILGIPFDKPGTPRDPRERTELICQSIHRLARFSPAVIAIAPGTSGDPANPVGPAEAVAENLPAIADAAAEHGLRVGLELLAERRGSPIHTLPAMAGVIEEAGRDNVGIMFDVFHSWCEPDLHSRIAEYGHLINSVQVCDVRLEERSGFDRELPGRGRGVAAEIIASLLDAGYDGLWELEVFSDDGTYGNDFPDSYWKMPHQEFLAQSKQAFEECYEQALGILEQRAKAGP